ncbi:MAG TPA: Hpt domain-containing protein [Bacteroidales bacterium]|nr:Hpt domain-containing protein [Bacteroidales bacterium]HSA43896.1 Hpt domain-containing protein [Bacteroidales bacterium]
MCEVPLYDLTAFRAMDEEDPGALAKIVQVFLDSTPEVLHDLNEAYQAADLQALAHLAHKLKATIDILSIYPLKQLIRDIEKAGKTGEGKENLPQLMETLNRTTEKVFTEIRREIS